MHPLIRWLFSLLFLLSGDLIAQTPHGYPGRFGKTTIIQNSRTWTSPLGFKNDLLGYFLADSTVYEIADDTSLVETDGDSIVYWGTHSSQRLTRWWLHCYTLARQPRWYSNQLNGHAIIKFDGNGTYGNNLHNTLSTATPWAPVIPTQTAPISFWLVAKWQYGNYVANSDFNEGFSAGFGTSWRNAAGVGGYEETTITQTFGESQALTYDAANGWISQVIANPNGLDNEWLLVNAMIRSDSPCFGIFISGEDSLGADTLSSARHSGNGEWEEVSFVYQRADDADTTYIILGSIDDITDTIYVDDVTVQCITENSGALVSKQGTYHEGDSLYDEGATDITWHGLYWRQPKSSNGIQADLGTAGSLESKTYLPLGYHLFMVQFAGDSTKIWVDDDDEFTATASVGTHPIANMTLGTDEDLIRPSEMEVAEFGWVRGELTSERRTNLINWGFETFKVCDSLYYDEGTVDNFPEAIYSSHRRLTNTYDGYLYTLRLDSDTTDTFNVGYDYEGYVDTSAINDWRGDEDVYLVHYYDQSGNEYDLSQTLSSLQAKYKPATLGVWPSFEFTGTEHYQVESSSILTTDATDFSVSVWLKTSTTGTNKTILAKRDGNNEGISAYVSATNVIYAIAEDDGGDNATALGTTTVTDGSWRQFDLTWDYSAHMIESFLNGSAVVEATDTDTDVGSATCNTCLLTLGAQSSGAVGFVGNIGTVMLMKRDATDADRAALYVEINGDK